MRESGVGSHGNPGSRNDANGIAKCSPAGQIDQLDSAQLLGLPGKRSGALGILSRYPLTDVKTHTISILCTPDIYKLGPPQNNPQILEATVTSSAFGFPVTLYNTHYYGKEDSYSRIDYLLASPGMAREWVKEETYIPTLANWGIGSDHRPVVATFHTENK